MSTTTKGTYRLCCESVDSHYTDEKHRTMKINRNDLKSSFSSDLNISIRDQMRRGQQPAQCRSCYLSENASQTSPRLNFNKRFEHLWPLVEKNETKVAYLDLRLGNKCNLKCTMCDPQNSSQHMLELNNHELTQEMNWVEDKSFLKHLEGSIETVEEIYFTGGEPLLIKDHYDILETIITKGLAPNICLKYNTNGTVFPSQLLHLWPQFKKVSVGVSIDGIGPLNDHIRKGSNWNIVNTNVDRFIEHADEVIVHTCVMNLNVGHLLEVFNYCLERDFHFKFPYLNILSEPQHLALSATTNKNSIAESLLRWHQENRHLYTEAEAHFVDRILYVVDRLKSS